MSQSQIAIIEDEEMICASLSALLSREGFAVNRYTSPITFLMKDNWKEAKAIVSDVSMPDMDGVELGLALRKKGYTGPIFYITALGSLAMGAFGSALEPYVVIRKPFRAKDLVATMKLVFKEQDFEVVQRGQLPIGTATPVDLFFSVDESGIKMMQVAHAGEIWAANVKLTQAFEEGHRVYARRQDWRRYLENGGARS